MRLLSYIGQHSGTFLILGVVFAAVLPEVSSVMRPALPFLVALILAVGFAQFNFREACADLLKLKYFLKTLIIVLMGTIVAAIIIRALLFVIDIPENYLLLVIVFIAAPPLSSSISLSVLMGFNARLTLQVALLSMLCVPVLGPLCFAIVGIEITVALWVMGYDIALMIVGGFVLALIIQTVVGQKRIAANKNTFSGIAVITMILFLFPLFDGVMEQIVNAPLQAFYLLLLAFGLNLGGHILMRWALRKNIPSEQADALAFMFGNRNVSVYLAVLPFNPLLSFFIAVAQIPIYITPAIFNKRSANPSVDDR
jgi:hypothetical protein